LNNGKSTMMNAISRKWRGKRKYIVLAILIAALLLFRLMLPSIVKKYVNGVLTEIPGYAGHVNDIDISLIRGAYVVKGLYLNKVNAGSEIPFLDFRKTDISVEWSSLFKGKIVGEIKLTDPTLIYVLEDQQNSETHDPDMDDWSKALTDLVPIDINRLEVVNGKAAFVQTSAEPKIDLDLHSIDLLATNLRNVARTDRELPSTLDAKAVAMGDGTVTLNGKMDLVRKIPDVDISFALENTAAPALNDLIDHYAGINLEEGTFNLFSEIAIADGFLTGYIKPLLKDSKLISKDEKFLEKLWEGFVGFFKFILKNQKNNTLATKVPIEGDLKAVEGEVWPTVLNIFKNAWISAYKNTVDGEVDFDDANERKDKKSKK